MTGGSSPARERRLERAAWFLVLVGVAGLLTLAALRGSWSAVAGDESTFLAMTESLAEDGDLEFTAEDRARLDRADNPARRTVILQRAGGRVAYSKPVLYPLVAAPFFKLLGRPGLVAANALALIGAFGLFWFRARRRPERGAWALTIATLAATGAVLPQVAWSMGDALQLGLALAGATLCVGGRGLREGRIEPVAGGLALGLLIAMRLPNAVVAAAVIASLWVARRRRRSTLTAAGAVAGFALALLLNAVLIGSIDPYRAERATFNPATGYPAGAGQAEAMEQFVEGRATQRLGVRPELRPRVSAYAALYFLGGRHTGLLVYFPAAVVLFGAALRRPERDRLVLLTGAAGLAVFYLLWLPENYFGGASFVGNRYILPGLALLLPALARPPRAGWLIAVWAFSAVCLGFALHSAASSRGVAFSSQSHTYSGLYRALPYESTALAIEDREDRYFSDEFLRFVDGNAQVADHGFHLRAGAPPAEILLATPRPSGVLRFLVWADSPDAALVFEDWRGEQRFALDPAGTTSGGLVEIVAAPAWRRHPFWWTQRSWRAHAVRLAIETPAGTGARAELRHLGPYRLAPKFFSYAAEPVELPRTAVAGDSSVVRVVLTNRGRRPWTSEADVPVHLAHRLRAGERGGADGFETRFTALRGTVERGDVLAVDLELRWPRQAGTYDLELDLAVAGVELFQGWIGRPIASGEVEVAPPVAGDPVVSSR